MIKKTAFLKGDNIIVSEFTPELMQELTHGCFTIFKPDNSILCRNRDSLWLLCRILQRYEYELTFESLTK